VDSVQGYYDPITGEIVDSEYQAVHDGTLQELVGRLGARFWLRPFLEVLPVDFDGGKARWDGTSEGVPARSGTLPAFSLVVSLEDSAGNEVVNGRGGIQLAAKEPNRPVARDKLFKDTNRVRKAVERALAPVIARAAQP
jgi:hypothetical protein